MTAGVENDDAVVFTGEIPWHKTNCVEATQDDLYDWEKFGKKGNLLWDTRKVPLVTTEYATKLAEEAVQNGKVGDVIANTDSYAIVRSDTNNVLGVVGSGYTALNNRDAFSFFQDWLDAKLVELHTSGSLFSGRKCWILAKICQNNIQDVLPNDSIRRYILLSNSFDGSSAVRLGFVNCRVVCNNTLAAAHNSAESKLIRSVHSSKIKQNLEEIKSIMNVAQQEFQASMEKYRFLAKKQINTSDLTKYVKILLEIDKKEEKDISTRSKNIMKKIFDLMEASPQKIAGVSGTYWAAYNSFNQYLVHHQGNNAENRLNNIWWGINKSKNDRALNLALQMAS
jgi:phage/plasmid-like protein (TIGR03299 family)